MNMTYILSEYFGCTKPFRKVPEKKYDPITDTVAERFTTDAGDRAYEKLRALLTDLGQISGIDVSGILNKTDNLMLTGKGAY